MTGIEVVKRLRLTGTADPVLFLTQFDSSENAADAIAAGANDYLVKSASHHLLIARVRVLLRGHGSVLPQDVVVGPYSTDAANCGVVVAGSPVWLEPAQFELARYLLAHRGRLVTRSELRRGIMHLSDDSIANRTHSIDNSVRELKVKLKLDGQHGLRLNEVHRVGYRIEDNAS